MNKNKKPFLSKPDYDRRFKRIGIFLKIPEAELLKELSDKRGILHPATYSRMLLLEGLNKDAALYPVKRELPGQENLFKKEKENAGRNRKRNS